MGSLRGARGAHQADLQARAHEPACHPPVSSETDSDFRPCQVDRMKCERLDQLLRSQAGRSSVAEIAMSFYARAISAMFKTDEAGRRVGFPYGAFGPGYLLPDSASEEKMQRVLSLLQAGGFTAVWIGYGLLRIVFG